MQQKKQNILLIKHGAFGDLIQSDGIFKSIKIRHPKDNLIFTHILIIQEFNEDKPLF